MTATRLDRALRNLSRSANKGRLWYAVAAAGYLVGGQVRRGAIRGIGALAATSFLTNVFLKPATQRRRPALERTPVFRRLHRPPRTTSFPSGHAASAAAFATGMTLETPAFGASIAPLAATVGYSRVHVGVHHVSDVVAGAALGAGIALATPFSRTHTVLSTLAGVAERNGVYQAQLVTELQVESVYGPVPFARDGEAEEPASWFRFAKLPGTLVVYRPDRVRARRG